MKPAVIGTVTAVNGDTITLTSKRSPGMMGRNRNASTTVATRPAASPAVIYSVDATNATVVKNNVTSTVSAISVGDNLFVQGTVTGTNVVATNIRDGMMVNRGPGTQGKKMGTSTSPIMGDGQPVVAGSISAINGDNLTVTTGNNVVYTVDVTNAKFTQGQNTITLANVQAGDKVIVQGAVNGTAITASNIIDQRASSDNNSSNQKQPKPGFFGRIGGFFTHLFGF